MKTLAIVSAILGVMSMVIGLSLAMFCYSSSNAAQYSPLNHFVSELGWGKMSSGAWIFNLSVVSAGVLFVPILLEMGRCIGTRLGWIATAIGVATSLSGSLVGVFPMDRLMPHLVAAVLYFWGLLLMTTMLTAAIWTSPIRGKAKLTLLTSFTLSVLCAAFVIAPKDSLIRALKNFATFKRPDVWNLAVMEWTVVVLGGFLMLTFVHHLLMARVKTPCPAPDKGE